MPRDIEDAATAIAVQGQPAPPPPLKVDFGDGRLLLQAFENEGGFLEDYVTDRSKVTNAPHEFHAFVGLALLGAAAGNRFFWHARGRRNFANQYYILIGPSAAVRKTTAINLGLDVLQDAMPNAVLPASFSRESFEDALERNPAGILVSSEFSEFLRKTKTKDYLSGHKELLTDLYDNPAKRVIRYRARAFTIIDPAPSILAASTLDWLEDAVDVGDLRGGFLVRFLPVVAVNPGPPAPLNISSWPTTALVQALRDVAANQGMIDFSPVMRVIQSFEERYMADLGARGPNPDLMGMYHRTEAQVMKLAALFSLSRTHGADLTVRDEDVLRASKVITYSHRQMELIPFSFTPTAKMLKRLQEMIFAKPGITQRDVLRALGITTRDLNVLVNTIAAMGFTTSSKPSQGGATIMYWPPSQVS